MSSDWIQTTKFDILFYGQPRVAKARRAFCLENATHIEQQWFIMPSRWVLFKLQWCDVEAWKNKQMEASFGINDDIFLLDCVFFLVTCKIWEKKRALNIFPDITSCLDIQILVTHFVIMQIAEMADLLLNHW